MNHHADYQRVEHRHGRGLGRRKNAAINPAQNDDGHQQRPARLQCGFAKIEPAIAISLAPAFVFAIKVAKQHQRAANENTGANACNEKLTNRHLGTDAVQDHRNRRRNDDPQLGATGLQSSRIRGGVAVFDQRWNQNRADGKRRGH